MAEGVGPSGIQRLLDEDGPALGSSFRGWGLLLLTWAFTWVAPGPFLGGQETTEGISGIVYDEVTGFPVGGVRVELVEVDGGTTVARTTADEEGRFALTLGPGHYWLVASRAGYASSPPREVLWDEDSREAVGIFLRIRPLDSEAVAIQSQKGNEGGVAQLLGRIVDHDTGRPILGAEVKLGASGLSTQTDRNGMFAFSEVPPGQELVLIRHLAYGEEVRALEVEGGGTYRLDGRLSPEPIELEGIEVRAISPSWYRRMDDLRFRMERGMPSDFILSDELEIRGYPPLADALRDVPGLMIEGTGMNRRVTVTRCRGGAPAIYLDGIKVYRPSSGGPQFVLSDVVSMDVEAIEVYKGPASVPGQFIDSDTQCGVILIWTKR
jgi:hypothetical protein